MEAFAAGFDTGYAHALGSRLTDLRARMSPAEYYWHFWFKFDLREATRGEQEAVRTVFLAQRLELDGFTPKHCAIVELILGRESEASRAVERGQATWDTQDAAMA